MICNDNAENFNLLPFYRIHLIISKKVFPFRFKVQSCYGRRGEKKKTRSLRTVADH
jgi:hypothetical protein